MKTILIYGAGGFAREVLTLLEDINADGRRWDIAGFLDDDRAIHGTEVDGYPVVGSIEWLERHEDPKPMVAMGIGAPAVKRKLALALTRVGAESPVLIHPEAILSKRVHIGLGTIITAGNVLTTGIRVGQFVTLNLLSTTGHDSSIGDYVTVAPGCNLSGNVMLREGSDIGTGTKIIQGVEIGRWATVGAGAVVTRNVPDDSTSVGVPAKVIKAREAGWHL